MLYDSVCSDLSGQVEYMDNWSLVEVATYPRGKHFPEVFQRFLILGFWSIFFVYVRCNN